MNIYINKKEIKAVFDAWDEVNEKLECALDEESSQELISILKYLRSIEFKYKTKFKNK